LAEYDQLQDLYLSANDRIQSGEMGRCHSGIHFEVMNAIQRYGKVPNSREEAIKMLKQLLTEYEEKHLDSQRQSDEEYLSQFDDTDFE